MKFSMLEFEALAFQKDLWNTQQYFVASLCKAQTYFSSNILQ